MRFETRAERRRRKNCDPVTGEPLNRERRDIVARSEAELPADVMRDIRAVEQRRRVAGQMQRGRCEWSPFPDDVFNRR